MERNRTHEFLIWSSSILCLVSISIAENHVDNYFINCGSFTGRKSNDGRVFVADQWNSSFLSTPNSIFASTTSDLNSTFYDPVLVQTARIFDATSYYKFPINQTGHYLVRLYFFPFQYERYNLSEAKFSVSAQNVTLFRDYHFQASSGGVKEYFFNVTSGVLIVTLSPAKDSFAFLNAIEVFSIPDNVIHQSARIMGHQGTYQVIRGQALETVERVNMGGKAVTPGEDSLWRLWDSDSPFVRDASLVKFESNNTLVDAKIAREMQHIAPIAVYGTATRLKSDGIQMFNANVTWHFKVDPGFDYLFRFHFCDITNHTPKYFNIYIGSSSAYEHFDIKNLTSNGAGVPYFTDIIAKVDHSKLNVSVGPSPVSDDLYRSAFLNGLEIMKISNSKHSLDLSDADVPSKSSNIKKLIIIVGLTVALSLAIVIALVLFLFSRRKKRTNQSQNDTANGTSKDSTGFPIFSTSKFGFRFPFAAVQEATDNFSESLVLGVGGFGKVYKGVLQDKTVVAIKRGSSQSQGIAEFRTEVEMLSQFRHRHLVSLIGYCDENSELIVIYEFMENGTLKDHLYGLNMPRLNWKQRLEICIGAAKGLHYLHTGSTRAIIHRDVKSANILVDENLNAKVSDFGLSKLGPELDQTHVSTAVKGSFGYLDPEYLIRQQLTEKSDVYSFGVVLLEVLSGRGVIDPTRPRDEINLIEWVTKCHMRGRLEELVDPYLIGQANIESMKKFGDIAMKCLAEHGSDRPSMGDVLWNLETLLQLQVNQDQNPSPGVVDLHLTTTAAKDIDTTSLSMMFAKMVREDTR